MVNQVCDLDGNNQYEATSLRHHCGNRGKNLRLATWLGHQLLQFAAYHPRGWLTHHYAISFAAWVDRHVLVVYPKVGIQIWEAGWLFVGVHCYCQKSQMLRCCCSRTWLLSLLVDLLHMHSSRDITQTSFTAVFYGLGIKLDLRLTAGRPATGNIRARPSR